MTITSTHMRFLALVMVIMFFAVPSVASAKSTVWNKSLVQNFYYLWGIGQGTPEGVEAPIQTTYGGAGWAMGLGNPNISVTYDTTITNKDSGFLVNDGDVVPVGTNLILRFTPHTSDHIYWFGTGYSADSPYGDWKTGAAGPAYVNHKGETVYPYKKQVNCRTVNRCTIKNVSGEPIETCKDVQQCDYIKNLDVPVVITKDAYAAYCYDKDLLETTYIDEAGYNVNAWRAYVDLVVNPPTHSITTSTNLVCGALSSTLSADCKVTVDGPITASFNFGETYGKFYYRYAYGSDTKSNPLGWAVNEVLSYSTTTDAAFGTNCVGGNIPLHASVSTRIKYSVWNDTTGSPAGKAVCPAGGGMSGGYAPINGRCLLNVPPDTIPNDFMAYTLSVPVQTITYTLSTGAGGAHPPSTPVITGPTSGVVGTAHTFSFVSTDQDNDQLRYGVDWNNDHVVDQLVPASGYVDSGVSGNGSKTWATTGSKTFNVLAEDTTGLTSGWATHTIAIAEAGLAANCWANPSTAGMHQNVNWNSSVSGGIGPFTYSWSGTEGLSGSESQILKQYDFTGHKDAWLTVVDTGVVATPSEPGTPPTTSTVRTCLADGEEVPAGHICSKDRTISPPLSNVGWDECCSGVARVFCPAPNEPAEAFCFRKGPGGSGRIDTTTNPGTGGTQSGGTVTGNSVTVQCGAGVEIVGAQCSDGLDNNGNGKIDIDDVACHTDGDAGNPESYNPNSNERLPECSDGIDNDGNGVIDFPEDQGCTSALDDDEFSSNQSEVSIKATPALVKSGESCTLIVSAKNVSNCTLTGTGLSKSLPTDKNGVLNEVSVTSPKLLGNTDFTLTCKAKDGNNVSKTAKCKVTPSFEEF